MKYIELNTHHDGEKVIVRKDAIDCFYDDHNRMGSVICINSISFRVKETYEELRYRLVDPVELQ